MREIPVSKGHTAFVDDDDFDRINKYRWSYHGGGYAARGYHNNGKLITVKLHQEIMGKSQPGYEIDHINGHKLDNRKCNLRIVTHQQNVFNSKNKTRNAPAEHTSRYKGVYWRKARARWVAYITLNGKRTYLGSFQSEQEAALAYNKAAEEKYGKFAKLNNL